MVYSIEKLNKMKVFSFSCLLLPLITLVNMDWKKNWQTWLNPLPPLYNVSFRSHFENMTLLWPPPTFSENVRKFAGIFHCNGPLWLKAIWEPINFGCWLNTSVCWELGVKLVAGLRAGPESSKLLVFALWCPTTNYDV